METSAPSRPTCPHCGATVHGGMQWCTLCYRSLDEPAPSPEVAEPDADPDALDGSDHLTELDADPDTTYRHVPPPPDVEALADEMIARLAASADAPLGDGLGERLGSRVPKTTPAKVAFMTGAGVAGCLLLLLALWLLGLLL